MSAMGIMSWYLKGILKRRKGFPRKNLYWSNYTYTWYCARHVIGTHAGYSIHVIT